MMHGDGSDGDGIDDMTCYDTRRDEASGVNVRRYDTQREGTRRNETRQEEALKSPYDMLGISWSSLGSCMEIAGASDAEWLLMLDISRCPSQDGHKPQDLRLF